MITEKELQTALQSFVGQEYEDWRTSSDVFRIVRQTLASYGISDKDLYYKKDHQTIKITYKKHTLLEVFVSKAKGKKHYGYCCTSYCDWTVKGISVYILNDEHDLIKRMTEIDQIVVAGQAAANKQLQEAITAVKAIKAAFPNKEAWGLRELVKYIADNSYTVLNQID